MTAIPSTTANLPLYTVEIVTPGVAFTWTADSLGVKVVTNIPVDKINNRTESPVLFKSESEVWKWARRVSQSKPC